MRDDVRLLGELLGETLRRHEGEALFDRVERVRSLAKTARGGSRDFEELAASFRAMPVDAAVPIARAFAHFLSLANIAEQHHRVRRRREYARARDGPPQPGSCEEAFARLRARGVSSADLAAAVGSLRVELVLTAHPTEIVRRTLIQSHNRIADALAARDRSDSTPAEQEQALDALRREIATAWQTTEVRDRPVSPLDEVRAGLVVFEQTLWDALPRYLRAVDRAIVTASGTGLPIDAAPVRFGSWIGGDRDGNPNVTPEITRQATWLARWMAADLYLREVRALRTELSLGAASHELRERAGGAAEPYRAVLRDVVTRLEATRAWAAASIDGERLTPRPDALPYFDAAELAEVLGVCRRSLEATGNDLIASGRLRDLERRVTAFGLTLARLDLRQEAARHTEAIDWIAVERRLGAYADAPEADRQALVLRQLADPAFTLDDLDVGRAPDRVRDVLETFRMASALSPDSLGAYVITMASRPSDVLAVELLQRLARNAHPQRVVPLFETRADLDHAGSVLDTLFTLPWYRERIDGRQEVMVGYSDSAKDAGRFAAAWALYRAQEHIVAACARHGVRLTLFHGRGGSIGRGGGPTYLAVASQPPGSVDGTMRVTEQGEMIQAKFGLPEIAVRTLEVYTTATLDAMLAPAPEPRPEWRAAMDRLAECAGAAYRAVVYDEPRFVEYFRAATPEPELRTIHIGSRPARRATGGGVESLRAIPWQFAWTQTRLLLASWLGVEAALDPASADGRSLRGMYEEWPFFRSTIDLIEMVLANSDEAIAAEYDRRLVPDDLQPLGRELRARLTRAVAGVLAVTGHRKLVEGNPVLRRSIDVRNPYVDPINLTQIELLRRLRAAEDDERLRRAFIVTVNGIAAGLRSTG